MEVVNCKRCGNIFNFFTGDKTCATCRNKIDEQFDVVKDYIYENPGSGIQEVATACNVSMSQIKKWVREEKLEFTEDSVAGIGCERCGVSIRTGRFCKSCKNKLSSEFNSLYKVPEGKVEDNKQNLQNHKMRFLE